ncbi:MAG: polyphosphate polymerase domain-containing protein [Ruminococcaceae bacterium]|nr:polyphosphate polymerase domain-containing protein [Oscillospiraceae bacterium]
MAERIEEKYIISYAEYQRISHSIKQVLVPDKNGKNGKYSICSLYFDDVFNTALREKEDGNAVHIKFRIRTYNGENKSIRLERKTKRGIVTEKHSALIDEALLDAILKGESIPEDQECFGLVSEMQAKGFKPAVTVKYDREAYVMPQLGIRVTFDMNVDSLTPHKNTLFGETIGGIPAISRNSIILEIKYTDRCPSFIRKCCQNTGMQLSVSKYALCRHRGEDYNL